MWIYDQSSGRLLHGLQLVSTGYSGHDRGLNNPKLQAVRGIGPIPRGRWLMTGLATDMATGPYSIVLAPQPGTDACGRSAFRIHGDNARLDHSASHGCIILPVAVRHRIWASGDRDLEVTE